MRDRAEDRQFVRASGHVRQMLADERARHAGGDWFELAAELDGGVGLEIPGILLRWAAPHEQEDDSLGLAETGKLGRRSRRSGRRFCFEQMGQGGSQESQTTDSQELAPAS